MKFSLHRLKMLLLLPVEWTWILAYYSCSQRDKIDMDLDRFCGVFMRRVPTKHHLFYLVSALVAWPEFRSLFLFRLGRWSHLLKWLMLKRQSHLGFDVPRHKLGGGLFIQHGYCTDLSARSIGEHCWINQRVTIGYKGNDCPVIGNNVRIGVGAVILGNVTVGDNACIGANAIVVHDVPAGCTVCSPAATIIKRPEQ